MEQEQIGHKLVREVQDLQYESLKAIYDLPEIEYNVLDRSKVKDIILDRVLVREHLESLANELSYDIYAVISGGDYR